MYNLNRINVTIMFFVISIGLIGCRERNNNNKNEQIDISFNQTIEDIAYNEEIQINNIIECDKLLKISKKAYDSPMDDVVVEEFINALYNFIICNEDFECIKNITGIDIITTSEQANNLKFNIIRYDGNPIGLGTLERTWTFLQILNNSRIDVFQLFAQSAEYPLYIKTSKLSNENYIISVAGVTNVSRSNTAFISFWEYGSDGLKEYTEIDFNSEYLNDKLSGNDYYIESDNINGFELKENDDIFGLYDIKGNNIEVNSVIKNDIIIIRTSNLN